MIKTINSVIVLLCVVAFTVACQKNNEGDPLGQKLAKLKSVVFNDQGEEIISSKLVRDLGSGKKEYLKEVKKSLPIDPVEIVENSNDIIYPGSILRGDSFMEGGLDPVVITDPKEITISISLRGKGLKVKKTAIPSVSDIRQQMNELITDEKIDDANTPSYLKYYSNSVTTSGSFNKTFQTHARTNVLFGLVKNGFNYEMSSSSGNSSKYVLIKVRQFFYNIAVDPKAYDQWGDLNNSNLGDYEPVYVSSVDYGRVAHLLIKTNESAEEVHKKISGAVKAGLLVRAGIGNSSNEDYARYFNSQEMTVTTLGGPLKHGKLIVDFESFIDFLLVPTTEELIKSAVPISYKIRTVKDNKEVQVKTFYTEIKTVRE